MVRPRWSYVRWLACGGELGGRDRRRELLLRLGEPVRVLLLTDHPHRDRHVGVAVAAELRALPVEDALLVGLEPGLVEPARDRVQPLSERGYGEVVENVRGRHLEPHDLADGHDHLVVNREEARLAGLEVLLI